MVDFRVVVIRATGQNDAVHPVLLDPLQGLHALVVDILVQFLILDPGSGNRGCDLILRGKHAVLVAGELGMVLAQLHVKALGELVLHMVRNEGVEEGDVRFAQGIDVELQGLGVGHDDGAIEMVAGGLVFLTLVLGAGHPNEVDVLFKQVHDVTMRELGRIANALGRHRFDTRLVGLLG